MPSLWQFGGLTPLKLIRLAIKKIGEDEISTRSAALSYYFMLALFPMLLFLLSLIGLFTGRSSELGAKLVSGIGRLASGSASELIRGVMNQTMKASSTIKLAAGLFGALWAASAGMGAVVESLNVIYEQEESRPLWKRKATVVSLTLALALLILLALVLVLYGGKIGELITQQIGLGGPFRIAWRVLQWPLSFGAMFLSFSIIYYFGPDVKNKIWHWVTPGAAAGVFLWLIASLGFRLYLRFFNSYSATYGSLGAVIILLLWLYITGFAILIGGEVNWVIENEDKRTALFEARKRGLEEQLGAA